MIVQVAMPTVIILLLHPIAFSCHQIDFASTINPNHIGLGFQQIVNNAIPCHLAGHRLSLRNTMALFSPSTVANTKEFGMHVHLVIQTIQIIVLFLVLCAMSILKQQPVIY